VEVDPAVAGEIETDTELTDEALAGCATARGNTPAIMAKAAARAVSRHLQDLLPDLVLDWPNIRAFRCKTGALTAQLLLWRRCPEFTDDASDLIGGAPSGRCSALGARGGPASSSCVPGALVFLAFDLIAKPPPVFPAPSRDPDA
jgi:hypothetical protein